MAVMCATCDKAISDYGVGSPAAYMVWQLMHHVEARARFEALQRYWAQRLAEERGDDRQ